MSPRDPIRSLVLPAIGATRMIRIVSGRNAAPVSTGGVAEDVLHVERDEEEDAEHRERDEQHDEIRARVGAAAEELERQHRLAADAARSRRTRPATRPRATNAPTMRAEVQPYVLASMRPYVSANSPTADVARPGNVEARVRLVTRLVDEEEARDDRRGRRPGR